MKLAFSTLGCPDWTFTEIFTVAKDLGLSGIEIRGIRGRLFAPDIPRFSAERLEETKELLRSGRMEIPMLTSGAVLGDPAKAEEAESEAMAYIDLAGKLNSPFIRVMISPNPFPEDCDVDAAAKLYGKLCAAGEKVGVTPLIETNGVLADSARMASFLDAAGANNSGVLWDLHHPYRYCNETPAQTFDRIGKAVKYLHVKDSVMVDGRVTYKMMGYGDVPVRDALAVLNRAGYDGYVTLEWVKRWNPELEEAGIVFAHYASFMKFLLTSLAAVESK
ncbi:MAG: sugar phosphate isomerase/epimerase [Ruminococcaceae bacterium]|nr:sugar phosphate isomerase/epimerase [Oscillospiraceae bacterium]